MKKEIMVVAEHRQGALREVTLEMLAYATRLSDAHNFTVSILILAKELEPLLDSLPDISSGLLAITDPMLEHYNADTYLVALEEVILSRNPSIIMMGHTAMGMDLAPALAARLNIPVVTDCLEIGWEGGGLTALRQVYGGKVDQRLLLRPTEQYIVTIRPGSLSVEGERGACGVKVEKIPPPSWDKLRGRSFLEYLSLDQEDVDISEADILVSIGRGIGKPENIPIVEAFAQKIGATLSCSRPVADKGWLPKSRQVGTSGKTVRPKLYIALGISGAFQHQAGMKNSGTIIAINKDPKAPIFKVAHYGIVADIFQVLPVLSQKLAKD